MKRFSGRVSTVAYSFSLAFVPIRFVERLRARRSSDYRVTNVDNDFYDIDEHVPPGKTRAPFFRYIRINLPRLTRAFIVAVMAVVAASAFYVAAATTGIFTGAQLCLCLVGTLASIFVLSGLVPRWRIWDFGLVPALGAVLVYVAGLFGTAPYVWNGASIGVAAAWNVMLFASLGYGLLYWALNYGVIAAYPDDQGFED